MKSSSNNYIIHMYMTYIMHVHDIIGFQKRHLQYAPLFHVDYFLPQAVETLLAQDKLLPFT